MLTRWLAPSSKRLLVKLACNSITGRIIAWWFRNAIPCHGCVINTDLSDISPTTKATIFFGVFESAECRFIEKHLRNELDTIELGSGIGVVSSLIASSLKEGVRLICVEANPRLLSVLRTNLETNNNGCEMRVVHAAIARNSKPTVQMRLCANHIDSHETAEKSSVEVPAMTLERLLENEGLDTFQLIADIEGAEISFIQSDSLKGCRKLIVELHDTRNAQGEIVTVCQMQNELRARHNMHVTEQRGNVFVYVRP